MRLRFHKVIIHNFLSYGHAEIDLENRGYCAVSGINNNPKDNTTSNGSGKTSWSSAICWALTGETSSGITSGVKNIYIDENSCYVTVDFTIDNDRYLITRSKEPKSMLTIVKNGEDKSGKTLTDSKTVLSQLLPDLTGELIASIIILGQGLPNKFTNNSPAGRKEVLEKLSKSDFMIQDLKKRLDARTTIINQNLRASEDLILSKQSQKTLTEKYLTAENDKLISLQNISDLDSKIDSETAALDQLVKKKANAESSQSEISKLIESYNADLEMKVKEKNKEIDEDTTIYNEMYSQYLDQKSALTSDIKILETKINQLKNIRDICPTCGQRIPNVVKPSTIIEETKLAELRSKVSNLEAIFQQNKNNHENFIRDIDVKYNESLQSINENLTSNRRNKASLDTEIQSLTQNILQATINLEVLRKEKENYTKTLADIHHNINSYKETIKQLEKDITDITKDKDVILEHIHVLSQMNTFMKRDFRGFLLSNVIDYINRKMKDYSKIVFGNNELNFELHDNNIDIEYLGKPFENLSGGEQQKINLIIQFAIRNMMCNYLNFNCNILVLDELFDSLDVSGCSSILNLLEQELSDVESMFIISHRINDLSIPSDSELIIVKDENGISHVK